MQALREIGFKVYGIGKPQPPAEAETESAEATGWGGKSCPRPHGHSHTGMAAATWQPPHSSATRLQAPGMLHAKRLQA